MPYDAVTPGQTVEHEGKRYTVDHITPIGITTTAGFRLPKSTHVNVLTERGIPALDTEPEGRTAGSVVRYWSGMRLAQPGTLTRAADLRSGDLVQSAHGYRLAVTEMRPGALAGELHHAGSGLVRTEPCADDSLIPVLAFAPRPRKRGAARTTNLRAAAAAVPPNVAELAEAIRVAFGVLAEAAPSTAAELHADLRVPDVEH